MRHSLFLKVYATLLATLAVVAIASFMFVRMGMDEEDRGWANRRDHFLAAMLPPDADPAALGIVLDRLAVAFDGDIAVFGPDGKLIAAAGNALPAELVDDIRAPPRRRRPARLRDAPARRTLCRRQARHAFRSGARQMRSAIWRSWRLSPGSPPIRWYAI